MARPKNNYQSKQISVPVALIPEVKRLISHWQLSREVKKDPELDQLELEERFNSECG